MSFTSILDKAESTYKSRRQNAAYLQDLNLDQIIERIQFLWPEDITAYYQYFPENEACEKYRRDVYADVKKEAVREALTEFVSRMRERSKALANKAKVGPDMQKGVWHLWEVYHYCIGLEQLHGKLGGQAAFAVTGTEGGSEPPSETKAVSEGLQSFAEYLGNYLSDGQFAQMKTKCFALIRQLQNFHLVLKMENDRLFIGQEELEGAYETFLNKSFPETKEEFRSPFAAEPNMSNLEKEVFQMFSKKNSAFFEEVMNFYQACGQYADDTLLRFGHEIGFYLAFYKFEEMMRSEGFAFAAPEVNHRKEMQAAGLYDLALAYVNSRQNKEVVSNDMVYHEEERFFIVTGPNQGGKTTFARSLGQLVYFTKMGLDVPAVAANVPYFSDILSHFSVEESIETGHGKLKEELVRLEPMMKEDVKNAFVIVNELFTTAANYDACIMGKQVLEHFLKQGCRGVYVTHLKELSEGEAFVSLCALVESVEEPGDGLEQAKEGQPIAARRIRNIRRYKMIRSEADYLGYAGDLVDKHRLSYEQIGARIKQKQKGGI